MNHASTLEHDLQSIHPTVTEAATAANAFLNFAHAAEHVCRASKRADKSRSVTEYFKTLSDDDLPQAARYLSGQIFPVHERRHMSVGPATLMTALASVLGLDVKTIRAQSAVVGDLGTVAQDYFERHEWQPQNPLPLTLQSVHALLDKIFRAPGTKQKAERLKDLLRHAGPLEIKYLVKMIAGDLRIGLQESTVEEAISQGTGTDLARLQQANILTGDIGATAVLARHGQLEGVRVRLFQPLKFMLASSVDVNAPLCRLPDGVVVEDKYDGLRVQVHLGLDLPELRTASGIAHGGLRVAIFSRTLEDVTALFADLIPALAGLLPIRAGAVAATGLILDGEIILRTGETNLPLSALRAWIDAESAQRRDREAGTVAFVTFDILCRDGNALIQESWTTRAAARNELTYDRQRTLCAPSQIVLDPDTIPLELHAAIARGNEGIVLKDPRSSYRPGRQSSGWMNVKPSMATLDVVVTVAEVGRDKKTKHLSNYTVAVRASRDNPRLLEVGCARAGLSDQDAGRLSDWFRAHTTQQYAQGKVRRVVPQVVLEVAFQSVKPSGRYESGFALQLPRIVAIRHDKPVAEIDTLETVRRIAAVGAETKTVI